MGQPKAENVEIQFVRGLRQDLEPDVMIQGGLTVAQDVEFDRASRLQKRDGFTLLGTATLSKTADFATPLRRTAEGANGERLVFTDENSHVYFPAFDSMSQAGQDHSISCLRASVTSRFNVGADQAGSFLYAESAAVGNWLVIAYVQADPQTSGQYNLYVDVLDQTTKARALSGAVAIGSVSPIAQPRIVVIGDVAIILDALPSPSTQISYCRLDLSGSTVATPGGLAPALLTDLDPALPVFDTDLSFGGFVIAYRSKTGTTQVTVSTYTSTPTLINSDQWLAQPSGGGAPAPWATSCVAVCGTPDQTQSIFVTGYMGAGSLLEILTTPWDISSQILSFQASMSGWSGGAIQQMALTRLVETSHGKIDVGIIWSACEVFLNGLTTGPRGHIFQARLDNNSLGSVYHEINPGFANYVLGSKFYTDLNGNQYAWGRFNVDDQSQAHYLLLDYAGNADQNFQRPSPVAHVANALVPTFTALTNPGLPSFPGIVDVNNNPSGFLFSAVVNIGASLLDGQQIGVWFGQALGSQRYLSTVANRNLLVAGGTPLSYDGQRLVESSFYSYPSTSAVGLHGSGASLPAGVYQWRHVYEWTDAVGNRHQSPASPAILYTTIGSEGSLELQVSTIHATRKQVIPNAQVLHSDERAPIRIVTYRTTANGSVFFKLPTTTVNLLTTASNGLLVENYVTIVDGHSDASIEANEILYTADGGEGKLSSNAPPPCLYLTVSNGRIYGLDAENPERIWCSKLFETGEAAGYNPALQILIPGCGAINGCGGQDDKLYGFATGGTYIATYGPGPDNTGQGVFPDPSLITTAAGCDDPRGVLVSENGIYFTGPDHWGTGIYLLRRGDGAPTSIGLRVRDELVEYPQVKGVSYRQDKGRVEFLFVDQDSEPSEGTLLYYHYKLTDEENIGQWTKAVPFDAKPFESIGTWAGITVGGVVGIYQDEVPIAYQRVTDPTFQGSDDEDTYSYQVVTGDIRPFGIAGYGDVHSLTLVGSAGDTASAMLLAASYDSGEEFLDVFATDIAETGGLPTLRRWDLQTKKLPFGSVRFSIQEQVSGEVTNLYTNGVKLHGITLEAVPLGGNVRLPSSSRG